jgi:hypothetical protein
MQHRDYAQMVQRPTGPIEKEFEMAVYAVDRMRQPMTATGIVEAVPEWEQTPEGGRRPSDRQARDERTGMPLWAVEVLYVQTSFGRPSTVTAKVSVGAQEEPSPSYLTPIGFGGLRVEARTNKAGGFVESWYADDLAEAPRPGKQTPGSQQPASSQSSGSQGQSGSAEGSGSSGKAAA